MLTYHERPSSVTVACFVVAAATASLALKAQAPKFDVASVKPNRSGSPRSFAPSYRNGKLTAENVTLKTLLQVAYDIQISRIVGPDWIGVDRFDLAAKAPEELTANLLGPMLQLLLKERFQLTVHREIQEALVYDLVAAKGGVKLRAFDREHPPVVAHYTGGAIISGNASMSEIADALARHVGRPVLDKTGMDGKFFYTVNYAPLSAQAADNAVGSDLPDLFAAVQQQMGLKLESKKESIEVLIVDQAARVPTDN